MKKINWKYVIIVAGIILLVVIMNKAAKAKQEKTYPDPTPDPNPDPLPDDPDEPHKDEKGYVSNYSYSKSRLNKSVLIEDSFGTSTAKK